MDSKKDDSEDRPEIEEGNAPRARNRTVMLTPEMTGQLRSRMGREGLMPNRDVHEQQSRLEESQPVSAEEQPQSFRPMHLQSQKPAPFSLPTEEELSSSSTGENFASVPQAPQPPGSFRPVAQTPPEVHQHSKVYWSKQAPVLGFLVSYDADENGEIFELRQGRIIVTSERAAHGDYLVITDETISPMHAILRITGAGEVQVLDQLSEYGTKIKRLGSEETEDLSGERSPVGHGDIIYFGKRAFHVCMVVRS